MRSHLLWGPRWEKWRKRKVRCEVCRNGSSSQKEGGLADSVKFWILKIGPLLNKIMSIWSFSLFWFYCKNAEAVPVHPSTQPTHPSMQASIHPSTHLPNHSFIHPSIHSPTHSISPSTDSFIQLSIHPSTLWSINPLTHPPTHSFIHPSVCPSTCSSVCGN